VTPLGSVLIWVTQAVSLRRRKPNQALLPVESPIVMQRVRVIFRSIRIGEEIAITERE